MIRYERLVGTFTDAGPRMFEYCGFDYDSAAVESVCTAGEISHGLRFEPYLDPPLPSARGFDSAIGREHDNQVS